jgi:phage-related tail fiber protein
MPLNTVQPEQVTGVLKTANNLSEVPTFTEQQMPVGAIIVFTGATIPKGWLLCDGAAYSAVSYSALSAVIGTTFGAGPNLPNISNLGGNSRQRYIIKAMRFDP